MTALPAGVRLLHIGPHKTGTTTLQAAFHQNREQLAAQGVLYAGKTAHPMVAAMAAASGRALPTTSLSEGIERWRALVSEMASSDARATVVSSEFFSEAPQERIRAIVDDLGAERTHVAVTVRPLVQIVGSQWQQYMQNRPSVRYDDGLDYEAWLAQVLEGSGDTPITPSFWQRHRHDSLVRSWAQVVGPERVTVIVVDGTDRRMLVRSFEELLDLTEGTLEPRETAANRSLTFTEVEMLRAFNRLYLDRGWDTTDYTHLVRFGAVRFLQRRIPGPGEPRLLTPEWAVDLCAQLGGDMAREISRTGVEVIGDLDRLGDSSVARDVGNNPTEVGVPVEVVARFTAGLVKVIAQTPPGAVPANRLVGEIGASMRRERRARTAVREQPETRRRLVEARAELASPNDVEDLTSGGILRVVAGRVRARLRREAGGIARRRLSGSNRSG